MLDVILRTCDSVPTVHYGSDGKTDRVVGPEYTKLDVMIGCINSLIKSMNRIPSGLRLIVVDDHSSDEGIEKIKQVTGACNHPAEFISIAGTGNGDSLAVCYKFASESESGLFYFVEDDYLHDPTCIEEMVYEREVAMSNLNGKEVAIFPPDNVDNYVQVEKNSIPCYMFLGKTRHWRTVTNATSTFLCSKNIIDRYLYLFELKGQQKLGEHIINEDNTINLIWNAPYKNAGGAYLLSPIPSLAIHFHFKEHIIPYINWQEWWDKNKEE